MEQVGAGPAWAYVRSLAKDVANSCMLEVAGVCRPPLVSLDDTVTDCRPNYPIEDIEEDGSKHYRQDNEVQRTSVHSFPPEDVSVQSDPIELSVEWKTELQPVVGWPISHRPQADPSPNGR